MYISLRFDHYAMVVILQGSPDWHHTINHANRVFADGRIEQLGRPRLVIDYRSGTRHPGCARQHLTTPRDDQLLLESETLLGVPLSMGSDLLGAPLSMGSDLLGAPLSMGSDPVWSHGRRMGRD